MDSVELVNIARTLIDIDSTTGRESQAATWVAQWLKERGYNIVKQPVSNERFNVIGMLDTPDVVMSTHIDCVPPFFPSRESDGLLYGRGACDAKGILASQLAALEQLRENGERRVALLLVVGEERGSEGARAANSRTLGSRYLINGEPTNNKLGSATRGVYRVRLTAKGRAAHSSHPELGDSAIEKLLDALTQLRTIELPGTKVLGKTFYTVGLMSGGVAPNVVPPTAEAEVNFRTVGPASDIRKTLTPLLDKIKLEDVVEVPPVMLETVPGFTTQVFPFTTDIPLLSAWGTPLLLGPGSVLAAHTDNEHVKISEMIKAIDCYVKLAKHLLSK